ncbi:hypothetical protein RFI_30215 [Reticulomyxa filosa]|uniref:Uncharacterized protein n=1 Tax=Reticulomyxa filosa TaxID=46433 RepID=X6M177_RETFI|nr:hypothetical protein RFI_30215 [Reticulomyxa filosa]|eukprot:ETO07177.1 hypothetical protein RFI_30215 [Reticulomyxa filosa]
MKKKIRIVFIHAIKSLIQILSNGCTAMDANIFKNGHYDSNVSLLIRTARLEEPRILKISITRWHWNSCPQFNRGQYFRKKEILTLYEIITYGGQVSHFHMELLFWCCYGSNLVDYFCDSQVKTIGKSKEEDDFEKEDYKAIQSLDLF